MIIIEIYKIELIKLSFSLKWFLILVVWCVFFFIRELLMVVYVYMISKRKYKFNWFKISMIKYLFYIIVYIFKEYIIKWLFLKLME